ncbi:uncharacterized protein LACBIDRAFT_315512 [Laccaria bicolor S238N-H82]|uniref:Predicted protein n=1 Tax=Laccaria bicolor (strain S238N-H82 / ATCC MYA-4686) TaxID=486041 RepID=B0D2J9_LACBS|nr:uncharacterized protein LACBIDRAFT_315512 [Laccaria bicolor S238N-H82]EDR10764.1 predicted protein [Laccaria bicolor S238N-H82]|eukprot:XP_001878065.1 predicted protein [Laccaria bicolor S238N-H82]
MITSAKRHALFLTRLEAVASNLPTAVPAVRAVTCGFRGHIVDLAINCYGRHVL